MDACLLVPTKGIEHVSGAVLESCVNLISMEGHWCVTVEAFSGSMREKQRKGGGAGEASTSSGEGEGGG